MDTKICSTCKKELPFSDFYPHKRMKLGLQPACKVCSRQWHRDRPEYVKEKNRKWKDENPEYMLNWHRKKNYGLTPGMVEDLREKQNHKCPGCGIELHKTKECVDHCHETKKVRGLLCDDCNIALGRVKDSSETLKNLIAYIEAGRY